MSNKIYTTPLTDFYNNEVKVGDLVLGATAGGRFHKTQFVHAVVIGRTNKMLEVHSLGPWANTDKAFLINTIASRGHRGGRLNPNEIIGLSNVLTQGEVDAAMMNAKTVSYTAQFRPKAQSAPNSQMRTRSCGTVPSIASPFINP